MIIVVAWALVIWLVILLAFGPDLLKTITERKSSEHAKSTSAPARESVPR